MKNFFSLSIAAMLVVASSFAGNSAVAQDWGNVKIKFTYEDKGFAAKKIVPDKDVEFCGMKKLVEERLVVGKDGGLKNIVVFLLPAPGKKVPVHPDYEKTATSTVQVDNVGCRYEPHVAILRTSQSLALGNPDPIGHNVKGDLFNNGSFNELIPAKGMLTKKFEKSESVPSPLSCSIHGWMNAWLLVKDDPYAGVSSETGEVVISNVPVGTWNFVVWQEQAGFIDKVKQGTKAVEWKRGRMSVAVKKGENDLGAYVVPASTIEKTLRK